MNNFIDKFKMFFLTTLVMLGAVQASSYDKYQTCTLGSLVGGVAVGSIAGAAVPHTTAFPPCAVGIVTGGGTCCCLMAAGYCCCFPSLRLEHTELCLECLDSCLESCVKCSECLDCFQTPAAPIQQVMAETPVGRNQALDDIRRINGFLASVGFELSNQPGQLRIVHTASGIEVDLHGPSSAPYPISISCGKCFRSSRVSPSTNSSSPSQAEEVPGQHTMSSNAPAPQTMGQPDDLPAPALEGQTAPSLASALGEFGTPDQPQNTGN